MKLQKILVFIATMLLIFCVGTNFSYALQAQGTDASGSSGGGGIISPDKIQAQAPSSDEIQDVGGKILGVLQTVGVVLAVVILVILGIKYMMGSAEEKAEYKKTMIPYLVGAVFIFAAPILANIVYNFVKDLTN